MLPSDMNLRIGNVRNYNNKILISSPSFKIGTNLKINLDDDNTKVADVKPDIKPNKGDKQDVKPVIKPNKEHKQMLNLTSSSNRMLRNLIQIR